VTAWILWALMVSSSNGRSEWVPLAGYDTLQMCLLKRDSRTITEVEKGNNDTISASFTCFPSDFDPRPRN
jgi:hypothetical protein